MNPELRLTPAEARILPYICRGWTNQEIAAELHVARSTVRNHVSNMLANNLLRNRAHLAACYAAWQVREMYL